MPAAGLESPHWGDNQSGQWPGTFSAPIDKYFSDGHGPDMTMLTPKQAADRTGCGRSSIMRALASGHLKATRDNSGRWLIDINAADDWASMRPQDRPSPAITTEPEKNDRTLIPVTDSAETLAKLAVAEARLADALAERDRWREMAERLSQPRPSIWDRLLKR